MRTDKVRLDRGILEALKRPFRAWQNADPPGGGYDVRIDETASGALEVVLTFKETRTSEPVELLRLPPSKADFIGKALKYRGQAAVQFELERPYARRVNLNEGTGGSD